MDDQHLLSAKELAKVYKCSERGARMIRARRDEHYDVIQMGAYLKLHGITPEMIPPIVEMLEKVEACKKP